MEAIQIFEYSEDQIEFDLTKNGMVNATGMAKIFEKEVRVFMRADHVKTFIEAAIQAPNGARLGIKTEADLYQNRGRNGLWMHRVLALKFAAWLDPAFEFWLYVTFDKIMFGDIRDDMQAKALAEAEEAALYQKMMAEVPDFAKYINLKSTISAYGGKIKKTQNTQLSLFKVDVNN